VTGKMSCQFVTDSKRRNESFWFCATHKARVSGPLVPCFFSRYDGTPFEICSGWKEQGCPSFAHCHVTF
jgi:hypothetical protein